jgi:hypothetical protein
MKTSIKIFSTMLFFFLSFTSSSQETVTITEEKKTTLNLPKDYSKTLGLYIFPSKKSRQSSTAKGFKRMLYMGL